VAALVVAISSVAHASDVRVERREGAESCPDSASFAQRIGDVPAGARSTSVITVRFERTAKGFRSSVLTADGMQRSLSDDATSCDDLAEATLLAVRLALDLSPAGTEAERTVAPVAPAARETPAAREAPALSPAPSAPRTAIGGELLGSAALAAGIGAPIAAGIRGGAALTFGGGRWSAGVTGVVLPSQSRDVGAGQVDIAVAGGGLEACGRVRVSRPLLVALCARAEALRLSGTSHGFSRTEEQARPLFTASVLGRAQARLEGPLAVFLEVGAVVPVVRERFAIDGVGLVYDPPFVGGSAGIGALVNFE
jgi:hypothetical protein